MYNPLVNPIVYCSPKRQALKLSNGLYKIETIPVGAFVKDNAKAGDEHERIPFEVDLNTLKHWKNTFKAMMFNGIEVPMPLNHTEDPEARRATVVDFEIEKNDSGKDSLFTIFKFKDKEAEKSLKDTRVSVFVPPKFVDGRDNEYIYPIRHVAFTDYPVIPGLSKMQPLAIAASYVEGKSEVKNNKEKKKMPFPPKKKDGEGEGNKEKELEGKEGKEGGESETATVTIEDFRNIADKLGLEGIPDNKLVEAINHVIDAILEEGGNDEEGDEEGDELDEEGKKKGTGPVAHRIKHEEEHYHAPNGAANQPPIAAGFISLGRKQRLTEIQALAKDGYVTPATAKHLVGQFCTDDALQLAFSKDGDVLDNFDKTVELLKTNGKVVSLDKEKSQNDALELSYSDVFNNETSNPLMKDASRRAKAAGQA